MRAVLNLGDAKICPGPKNKTFELPMLLKNITAWRRSKNRPCFKERFMPRNKDVNNI